MVLGRLVYQLAERTAGVKAGHSPRRFALMPAVRSAAPKERYRS